MKFTFPVLLIIFLSSFNSACHSQRATTRSDTVSTTTMDATICGHFAGHPDRPVCDGSWRHGIIRMDIVKGLEKFINGKMKWGEGARATL
jgi:hypothetical protein